MLHGRSNINALIQSSTERYREALTREMQAIKMYNGRAKACRRGSRKYKKRGTSTKGIKIPSTESYHTAQMQMLSTNITCIRWMPSLSSPWVQQMPT